jgi:hypothetical protein
VRLRDQSHPSTSGRTARDRIGDKGLARLSVEWPLGVGVVSGSGAGGPYARTMSVAARQLLPFAEQTYVR